MREERREQRRRVGPLPGTRRQKKEYSRARRRGARGALRFFVSAPGSHVCVSACCKVSDFDAVEKELAERAGEQPKLGGDYAVDVVLTAVSQRGDFVVEGYTKDALDTSSPVEGYDFAGALVYDGPRRHYYAVRYEEGVFWVLDSVKPRPARLTRSQVEGLLGVKPCKAVPGVRHFRVFRRQGWAPGAAEPADLGEAPGLPGGPRGGPEKAEAAPSAGVQKPCAVRRKSYPDVAAFRLAVAAADLADRLCLFNDVVGAHVCGGGGDQDNPLFKCITACQEWGFLQKGVQCGACGGAFALKRREDSRGRASYFWRGPRPNAGRCDPAKRCECYDATRPLAGAGDLMRGVAQSNYVAFVDVLAMHLAEYPKKLLYRAAQRHGVHHGTVDAWVGLAQLELAKWVQRERKRRAPLGGWGKTVQMDETMVNRRKRSALNRRSRPREQRWLWGAVEQGRFDKCHIRILPKPEEALGGKPRGREEIDRRVREAGIRPGALRVTDGWKASKAVDWDDFMCAHDVVVHSRGEIVNKRGSHTNLIAVPTLAPLHVRGEGAGREEAGAIRLRVPMAAACRVGGIPCLQGRGCL